MTINTKECFVISFSRKTDRLEFHYFPKGLPIERVSVIRDVGVLLVSDLFRGHQLNEAISHANRLLGYIIRSTRGISSPGLGYFCLVRHVLEFAWKPYQIGHTNDSSIYKTDS